MKRNTVLNISLLLIGIVLGGVGMSIFKTYQDDEETTEEMRLQPKVIKDTVVDTVIVKQKVFITPNESADTLAENKFEADSLNLLIETDSLSNIDEPAYNIYTDTNFTEDEVVIIKERLIDSELIELILQESDSLSVEVAFNLKQVDFAEHMVIEFWESPLELTGYELSRNKLKLFGFNPSEKVVLSHSVDSDILEVQIGSLTLRLQKTNRFKTLYL